MDYLPVFVDVRGQLAVVVGGGAVAERKVSLLREAGARVQVVAPVLCAELGAALQPGALEHIAREYQGAADLDGARVVIAATDQQAVNAQVAADARARGVLANVVDQPALCGFVMPSIIDRAPVLIAVSTGGASPVLARLTRSTLEAALPARLGELADFAAQRRARVKAAFTSVEQRRAFWEQVLGGDVGQLVLAGRPADAELAFAQALARGFGASQRVTLIAAGTGNPDLLSLAALRALGRADLVLHERTVPAAVLSLARRDAARTAFDAGRALDRELLTQLVQVSLDGGAACVVRAGDPYAGGAPIDAATLRSFQLDSLCLRPAPEPG